MKAERSTQVTVKGYRGHRYFDASTLDDYLEALRLHLPNGFEHLRNHPYFNGTNPEVAYFNANRKDAPLTWDERAEIGRKIRAAEKKGNLVTKWDATKKEFEPEELIASSLYREEPATIDYLIIGVVGPRAKYYGMELFKAIRDITNKGSKQNS